MKILDIAIKDMLRSFRSAFAVGMMVIAPLMLTGLIYFAFGSGSNGTSDLPVIKLGILNLDTLPAGTPLETSLGHNIHDMFFDKSVLSWITASNYEDEKSLREAVNEQDIGVAVIIPQNFTERFLSGEKDVQVLVISDPTLSIGPAVVQNMVTMMLDGVTGGEVALETIIERMQANDIQPATEHLPAWIERYANWYREFQRNLFHDPENSAFAIVTPSTEEGETTTPLEQIMGLTMAGQMIFFAFFTGAHSMMSILREDEEGTLARLFTTPIGRTQILAGKFTAVFITVILQGLVLMIAGHYAFGINWGEPYGTALALIGQVVAATGLGVLLISFVKNTKQGGPVLGGGLTALGMLGGLFTASIPDGVPESMHALANFTPQGWVLKTWRMVMDGQPTSDLIIPFTVMLGMGIVMFIMGALMFRKRFA